MSRLLFVLVLLVSCSKNVVYREYKSFRNEWPSKEKAVFEMDITNTPKFE